jgi:tetratricopeptide (TPR) repeat protein
MFDEQIGPAKRGPARWEIAGAVLLALVTVLAYMPAVRAGYVWDDREYVWANDALRSLQGLRQIWSGAAAMPFYMPLTFTSFWLEHHLWGNAPLGYHVTNVALHILDSLLVWAVLRRLHVPGALLAAAIFAVHPVHTASVAWVAEQKNVLCGAFFLAAVLAWLRLLDLSTRGRYALFVTLFACAILSKAVASTLPGTVLLLAWWKGKLDWRRDLGRAVPLLLIAAGVSASTVWSEVTRAGPMRVHLSLAERALVAGRALWFYAGKLVCPTNLMPIYPRWALDVGAVSQWALPAAAVSLVVLLWVYRVRVGSGPFVGVVYFAITLSPTLDVVPYRYMELSFVQDQMEYLPSIGLIALLAAVVRKAAGTGTYARRSISAAVMAVLALLAALTWRQAHIYQDEETYWRYTLAENPEAWSAHYDLGTLLMERDQPDEALPHLQAAAEHWGDYVLTHRNLGTVLAKLGKLDEAIEQFRAEARLEPGVADGQSNWGLALAMQGKLDEAIEHYKLAALIDSHHWETQYNWGRTLEAQGKVHEALQHYAAAAQIDPRQPQVQRDLQRLMGEERAAP